MKKKASKDENKLTEHCDQTERASLLLNECFTVNNVSNSVGMSAMMSLIVARSLTCDDPKDILEEIILIMRDALNHSLENL